MIMAFDLSRKTNKNIPQQINFTGILEENDGATMFFILESIDSKFITRHWNIVNDQSNIHFSVGKEIMYSTKY